MSTEATKQQSLNYGCIVMDKQTSEVTHYVEKPSSYVSTLINCGIYVFSLEIFQFIGDAFNNKQQEYYRLNKNGVRLYCFVILSAFRNGNGNGNKEAGHIQLEQEILAPLAGSGKLFALQVNKWWSQLKTAGSAIYANRHYLELYKDNHPERLQLLVNAQCTIHPDVHIHPSASIHPSAVVNVIR